MRILITGGTGLIGRALTESLAADQHEVIVLSRNPDPNTKLPAGARIVRWDARTSAGWGELADGAGAIINLAGASIAGSGLFPFLLERWSSKRKRLILQSRIDAGQAVVQAIQEAKKKPGVLIQTSAVGYYGVARDEELSEESPRGNDFLARVCFDWEMSTLQAEVMGVRRAVIRPGVVLSRAGGVLPIMLLPFKFFVGGRLGSGRQWFPWIHFADHVGAIRFLIDTPNARGAFNLTAPHLSTNADFTKALGRVMRRPSFIPVPGFALKLVVGEKSIIVLEGQRPLPKRLLEFGYSFRFPEAGAALRDLLKKTPARKQTVAAA